jgi:hypothetical protein
VKSTAKIKNKSADVCLINSVIFFIFMFCWQIIRASPKYHKIKGFLQKTVIKMPKFHKFKNRKTPCGLQGVNF